MFYAHENSRNQIGSLLAGSDINCFDIIELPGFMPIYVVELPTFGDDGELEILEPILVNNIDLVISLKQKYESPLETAKVWAVFPGSMNNSDGWKTQQIKSIWEGTWEHKKEELTCTKLEFSNGDSILLLGNKPSHDKKVKWTQVL
nr:hypothetical protein [uncultured Deefgea sp.]